MTAGLCLIKHHLVETRQDIFTCGKGDKIQRILTMINEKEECRGNMFKYIISSNKALKASWAEKYFHENNEGR